MPDFYAVTIELMLGKLCRSCPKVVYNGSYQFGSRRMIMYWCLPTQYLRMLWLIAIVAQRGEKFKAS